VVDAGETDPCNVDTDGDGIQDGTELGYTLGDTNHNGMVDGGEDDPLYACPNNPVRILGASPTYFTDIKTGYDAAVDGDTIQIHAIEFAEDIVFDHDISVTLTPGYLCDYPSDPSAITTNRGSVSITDGTISLDNGCLKMTP